ncbi:MAG TPA: histidine--tRNA ligase [Candidatus Binataceae bacterium]|nr:histidine--tRNA ligase [Candidatus Binataceae bacterium]
MELTRLRGFQDLMGPEARAVRRVEECAREIVERHGFNELRIPLMERLKLYQRSSGETSDVVQKQMYLVQQHDDAAEADAVALRPEGTPGVIRAYIEAGLDRSDPEQRFYYSGPMLRYERPQKGRFREFNQFGVEVFGRGDAAIDAELLIMIDELRQALNVELEIQINSLGDVNCRPAFRDALLEYGRAHWSELCDDCHQRLDRNPLRLLDCKIDVKLAEGAPKSLDYLCEPCRVHFATVERLLSGAEVRYVVNPRLVRGLDYYMRTAFEVVSSAVGSQSAVVAGGRYDGLVEALGGAALAGTGFAIGVERMALVLQASGIVAEGRPDAALIALGEASLLAASKLGADLRRRGLRVEMLSPERGLKALMRRAGRLGARAAVIIGEDELARGVVQLRDLDASSQREVALELVGRELEAARNSSPD